MKFYIATKFENKLEVAKAKATLIAAGHEVPYDWTISQVKSTEQAQNDVNGVRNCDVVLALFEQEHRYKGAIAEIGMAIILGKPIFVIGNWLDSMIFMHLPIITKVNNVEEVISYLRDNNL
jgi:nucleoside 2-deoxyribosyltransferase